MNTSSLYSEKDPKYLDGNSCKANIYLFMITYDLLCIARRIDRVRSDGRSNCTKVNISIAGFQLFQSAYMYFHIKFDN